MKKILNQIVYVFTGKWLLVIAWLLILASAPFSKELPDLIGRFVIGLSAGVIIIGWLSSKTQKGYFAKTKEVNRSLAAALVETALGPVEEWPEGPAKNGYIHNREALLDCIVADFDYVFNYLLKKPLNKQSLNALRHFLILSMDLADLSATKAEEVKRIAAANNN